MQDKYRRTATTVSMIRYHFVFCPYRRRKIFDIPGVEQRFKELVPEVCDRYGYEILALECHHDHVHLFISASPADTPSIIMHQIKGITSKTIRTEFSTLSKAPSLWTRSFFVSTAGDVSAAVIKKYIDSQKVNKCTP